MAPMPLQQGDPSQVGRYQLAARLGAGGMGVVYLGEADDGQQVAVKVLRPDYADDPEFRARFQREAAALARVRNGYAVQVIDADPDSATPFLVTEFAEGPSLAEHVNAHGSLHPEAVFRLASALAEALDAIHAAGVTHRDLKPSNVLLTDAGPKVIDFGIARLGDEASITQTGLAIGSPGYMAPEQVTGHAGQEADIFAWALIVAFAASGQPPFGGGEMIGVLHRIVSESPDISAVPLRLMPLVQGALAKDPARRPTAADLVRELSIGTLREIVPRTAADPETAQRWRGAAIAAAAAVVLLAGTGAALLSHGGSKAGNGSSAGPRPTPSVTSSAASGTGHVSDTGAPGTQPGSVQGTPPGLAAKHKLDKGAADNGSNGYGGSRGEGGGAMSRPSASSVASPSGSASVSPSTSVSPSPSTSATSSPSLAAADAGGNALIHQLSR